MAGIEAAVMEIGAGSDSRPWRCSSCSPVTGRDKTDVARPHNSRGGASLFGVHMHAEDRRTGGDVLLRAVRTADSGPRTGEGATRL
jgi:hypothetical protein